MVVFNNLTGNTHLLNPLAGLVLTRLIESRAMISAAELTESIGQREAIEQNVTQIEAIGEVLDELERLGIAECDPE